MDAVKPEIVVLYNRPTEAGEPAEAGVVQEARDVTAALQSKGYEVESAALDRGNLFELISRLSARREATVVFNLCEAIEGHARHEPLVAGLLDLHGVRFTGNTAATLTSSLDKRITKALLFAAGIPTPGARVFRTTPKADAVRDMAFPLVVKPLREDASIGITKDSFVKTPEELCERVHEALKVFGQPMLGEVYLNGREFNVAVTGASRGAQALPASEIVFEGYTADEPRLVTYDAKWAEGSAEDHRTRPCCPAEVGEHLKVSLATAALAAHKALECRDYARMDLRLDHRGIPHVLEVNPNPDIARRAGLARAVEASGDLYEDFVERLVGWAWNRA
jgi:D-alanine-D-alanine ligase